MLRRCMRKRQEHEQHKLVVPFFASFEPVDYSFFQSLLHTKKPSLHIKQLRFKLQFDQCIWQLLLMYSGCEALLFGEIVQTFLAFHESLTTRIFNTHYHFNNHDPIKLTQPVWINANTILKLVHDSFGHRYQISPFDSIVAPK